MAHDNFCDHCEDSTCFNCDEKAEYGLIHNDGSCKCGGHGY